MNFVLALAATFLVALTLESLWAFRLPGWAFILVYLFFYVLIENALKRSSKHSTLELWSDDWGHYPTRDLSQISLSGPVRYLGRIGILAIFFGTQLLLVLNPWQLVAVIRQAVGNLTMAWTDWRTGETRQHYKSALAYRLPLVGKWLVLNGGMTPTTSHSWGIIGQRYALDFVKTDDQLNRHHQSGTKLSQYFAYGEPILAAAPGRVVRIEDRIKDAPLLGFGMCDFMAKNFIGNYVMIEHAPSEFGLYAHLAPGSLTVQKGDVVAAGQVIGQCGHTGHSTEPHLHFHLQDSPDPYHGRGLPVRFTDLVIGGEPATNARLRSGHEVESTA